MQTTAKLFVLDCRRSHSTGPLDNSKYVQLPTIFETRARCASPTEAPCFTTHPGPSQGHDQVIVASSSSERARKLLHQQRKHHPKRIRPILLALYQDSTVGTCLACFCVDQFVDTASQATGSMISSISPLAYHGFRPTSWT